ncbi:hypothetical protein ABTA30_18745, partial [Acinetobacter baumannii]
SHAAPHTTQVRSVRARDRDKDSAAQGGSTSLFRQESQPSKDSQAVGASLRAVASVQGRHVRSATEWSERSTEAPLPLG